MVLSFSELKPFIECSIVQRIIPHSNVKQFKYLKVLTQEFHVKVDLLFINEIVEMFTTELTDEEKVYIESFSSLKFTYLLANY